MVWKSPEDRKREQIAGSVVERFAKVVLASITMGTLVWASSDGRHARDFMNNIALPVVLCAALVTCIILVLMRRR